VRSQNSPNNMTERKNQEDEPQNQPEESHVRPSKMRTRICILIARNTGGEEILGVKKRAKNPDSFANINKVGDSIRGSLLITSENVSRNSPRNSDIHGKRILNGLP
jgi:hypothetical protein